MGKSAILLSGCLFVHMATLVVVCLAAANPQKTAIFLYCSSHAVTSDLSLPEVARAAEFFLSDGVIVTGRSTGCPASETDVEEVKQSTALPVLVGSGVNPENVGCYSEVADGLIMGSWFKEGGVWSNPLCPGRVRLFMDTLLSNL